MKILYTTTVACTMGFFKAIIRELIDNGHEVDIATSEEGYELAPCYREWGCRVFNLNWSRSPLKLGNLTAIGELKKLIEENKYDIVHCHTPIAAACTRLACKKFRKSGLKCIYTAHGFHFYSGAPLKNKIIYYPIEKFCSRLTDTLITINKEDFDLAKRKFKAKKIEYVPGVGIDVGKFSEAKVDRKAKRAEIGVPEDAFLVLSLGELNENKNHSAVIKAMALLDDGFHYAIAGEGNKKEELLSLAKEQGVENRVHLLGFRRDAAELYKTADLYILPSIREGLNVSVMEAMASGLPTVASRIRGNVDMVNPENCFCPTDIKEIASLIEKKDIVNSDFVKNIDYSEINKRMFEIYFM